LFLRRIITDIINAIIYAVIGIFDSIPQFDIATLIILVIIGIIIILLIRLILMLIPAVLIGFVVWLLTGSLFWAGVAFFVIAALSLLRKF